MMQRVIIEMGAGNSLHSMDYQTAAARAITDALRHSTLPILKVLDLPHTEMRVDLTIGVQDPAQIDTAALAKLLPRGTVTVQAVFGGQNVTNPETNETAVVATAAIQAFLPNQSGRWRQTA